MVVLRPECVGGHKACLNRIENLSTQSVKTMPLSRLVAFGAGKLMQAKHNRGFSLLELMITVAIILIVAALTVPTLMTQIYSVRLKYSATDLSGLLQRARMEAVRKNSFYSVQTVAGNPVEEQVVDKTTTAVASIPPAMMAQSVTVAFGAGSGAPGESGFITGLNFTGGAASAVGGLPSFNARGLPCIAAGGATCTSTPGQGFVFFLSGTSASSGSTGWSAVVVTASGRCQVWAYDGTNWIQQ